jgi:hypothetical protein
MQEIQATEAAITGSQESIDKAEAHRQELAREALENMDPDFTSHFGGNRAQKRAAARLTRKKGAPRRR